MKTYRQYNESVRDKMTPKNREEIEKAIKQAANKIMEDAEKKGVGLSVVDFFNPEYSDMMEEHILTKHFVNDYEHLLLYNGNIYKMSIVPGGDFRTLVDVINDPKNIFKDKLKQILDRI
jgi:hypothetical protein